MEPLTDVLHLDIQPRRLAAGMFSVFGGLALVLAAIGLYGVVTYAVQRRTREIGVRIALGAEPKHVLVLVVREVAQLILLGLAAGLAGGVAEGHLVAHQLFGIKATDPMTFVAVGALLAAAGLIAGYLPARRALRVDPVNALRAE